MQKMRVRTLDGIRYCCREAVRRLQEYVVDGNHNRLEGETPRNRGGQIEWNSSPTIKIDLNVCSTFGRPRIIG
jgi:hypothetical protein